MSAHAPNPATSPGNGEAIGIFYLWRPGDLLPQVTLPSDPVLRVSLDLDASNAAAPGDRRYRVTTEQDEVASGWISTRHADVGELGINVVLPHGHVYLWGYETQDTWRGRGLYPALLQEVLRREAFLPGISHAWIGHDVGNAPSARGITRAGFTAIARVDRTPDGDLVVVAHSDHAHDLTAAHTCATVFNIPLAT